MVVATSARAASLYSSGSRASSVCSVSIRLPRGTRAKFVQMRLTSALYSSSVMLSRYDVKNEQIVWADLNFRIGAPVMHKLRHIIQRFKITDASLGLGRHDAN